MRVFTIGYEGATQAELIATLRNAGVRQLIDVRAVPLSRKAGFSKNVLRNGLAEAGIDYLHLRGLGTPPEGREAARKGRHADLARIYAEQLKSPQAIAEAAIMLDHDGVGAAMGFEPWKTDNKFGTVGAVARDRAGRLAAGTSTGGLTNKFYGRVGDSPIVGAGTYADSRVAVSGTGVGEFFMRGLLAYDIAARVKYRASPLSEAVNQAIDEVLTAKGGQGGVIAIDAAGNIEFAFNTEGMYRGCIREGGEAVTAIYRQA